MYTQFVLNFNVILDDQARDTIQLLRRKKFFTEENETGNANTENYKK
jgi:hypothetical protein